jgi:glycosyltransferase involved in cell wall biosynthesis
MMSSDETIAGCRPKDVLFLTHAGDPGGAEFKMMALCKTLVGSAEVMLLQHGSLESMLRERQIKFSVCPMPGSASRVRRNANWLSILRAIPAALWMVPKVWHEARKFDVVICVSQKSFVLASLAKPFLGRPIFWFMNDILSTDHFSRWLIRFVILVSRYTAAHVAVNSKASLDFWRRSGGRRSRVSVIYPATLESNESPAVPDIQRIDYYRRKFSPKGGALIGVFGRINRWKGQDVFLRALAELPNVNGVIVGAAFFEDGEYENELKALARDLGVEDRVVFAGHIEDVMTAMAACDVVTHCSTSPEPFGQVIVQSMLAGTPVIASDGGGVREIVAHDETGQLTPRRDHHALAVAVKRCLEDPQWSRRLAEEAKRRAKKNFSFSAMTARFTEILEKL